MIYCTRYNSPLGNICLLSDGTTLTHLYTEFWHKRLPLSGDFLDGTVLDCLKETVRWLDIYFSGKKPDFLPPLSFCDSTFRQEIWNILLTIPYGELVSYGDIAKIVAKKLGKAQMSAQAVGGAVGANPIGIIVPCHRVIGTNNNLTGYAGGLSTKLALLKLEGINISQLVIPKKSKFL